MNRIAISIAILALFALTFGLAGCESQAPNASSIPPAIQSTDGNSDHLHDGGTDMEKMKVELAKLSPEDAVSAENQHVCPVSGEMLGTMGAPKTIDVSGQQVWICCDDCREKLLANPDTYLAKLKKE